MAQDFEDYLEANRDEIEALTIFFSQPARRSRVDLRHDQGACSTRSRPTARASRPLRVWQAYAPSRRLQGRGAGERTDRARRADPPRVRAGHDARVRRETVRRNFQDWILKRHRGGGREIQRGTDGLAAHDPRPRRHLVPHRARRSRHAPFDGKGGLGRMYELFGDGHGRGDGRDERGAGGVSEAARKLAGSGRSRLARELIGPQRPCTVIGPNRTIRTRSARSVSSSMPTSGDGDSGTDAAALLDHCESRAELMVNAGEGDLLVARLPGPVAEDAACSAPRSASDRFVTVIDVAASGPSLPSRPAICCDQLASMLDAT